MKKILLLGILLFSASAFAFGGGGGRNNRERELYKAGVDAIGVHIGGDCPYGEEMIDGKCYQKCAEGVERDTDYTCTVCTNGNVYLSYMDDPCGTETPKKVDPGMTCVKNSDCESGKHCYLRDDTYEHDYPTSSTCAPIGGYTDVTVPGIGNFRAKDGYEYSTWWAAENWCLAQGLRLVSLSDFGIDKNNLGPNFDANGFCEGDGAEKCENVDWTPLVQALPDTHWLSDSYSSEFSHYVFPLSHAVSYNYRYAIHYALCVVE